MFPHLHSQIHFALPGFESGSFSITFNLPNVLPLKSMRVGEEVCRRQPHDFVPLVRSRFVEDLFYCLYCLARVFVIVAIIVFIVPPTALS